MTTTVKLLYSASLKSDLHVESVVVVLNAYDMLQM